MPINKSRTQLISNESADILTAEEEAQNQNDQEEEEEEYFEGLENFSFHITMLLLLIIMSALNAGLTIAWIKSK